MEKLKLLIDSIKQGKIRPGEGLPEPYIEKFMPHTPPVRQQRPRHYKVGSHCRGYREKDQGCKGVLN